MHGFACLVASSTGDGVGRALLVHQPACGTAGLQLHAIMALSSQPGHSWVQGCSVR
jgi:hypothetical protein